MNQSMHFPNELHPADSKVRARSARAQTAAHRRTLTARINAHKTGLLEKFHHESEAFRRLIQLAVNEAEGLAWSTPYAHLLFPSLVEEKILSVRRWAEHQHRLSPGLHPAPTAQVS
jgi:hypothetical protein